MSRASGQFGVRPAPPVPSRQADEAAAGPVAARDAWSRQRSQGDGVDEPGDVKRARLLLVWLQARRALDTRLSELLAAGPAGETRVRRRLPDVIALEERSQLAFEAYRDSARLPSPVAVRPRLAIVDGMSSPVAEERPAG